MGENSEPQGLLRLANVEDGAFKQNLEVEEKVRALSFDDKGRFLFGGTKTGDILVFEVSDLSTLRRKFKAYLGVGSVTCITFVSADLGNPPCLLVNNCEN